MSTLILLYLNNVTKPTVFSIYKTFCKQYAVDYTEQFFNF